jgi:hypothetical protein
MNAKSERKSEASSATPRFVPILTAFRQTASEVTVREPGQRFLGAPRPLASEAQEDWEFAWLSAAAYAKISAGDRPTPSSKAASAAGQLATDPAVAQITDYADAQAALRNARWTAWSDFLDTNLLKKIENSHLRVEVWEKQDPASVAVTFGGTVFKSGKDWKSNLRWFTPAHDDEYTEIVRTFAPAFEKEYLRRANTHKGAYLRGATLYATGHSLGGGLAQQFAYCLPLNPSLPRVTKVYAFDPSPVTGFYSVEVATRNENKNKLLIDRIYERREVLSMVRSLTSVLRRPSAAHPCIRAVRYNLFHTPNLFHIPNPIAAHSIKQLACKLEEARRDSINA